MRATGSYRFSLVVVIAGAIGMIGGDVSPVVGETQNGKRLTTARTPPPSSDATPQAVMRSEESATVTRRGDEFDRVRAVARASGSVRVIVQLDVPNLNALTAASTTAKGRGGVAQADGQLSGAIGNVRGGELAKLAGTQHSVNRTYASVPFVAMTVSERALDVLRASPGVLGINEDHLAAPTLNNTVNITGASAAWGEGFDGSGWYVAILDTGIRASHHFFAGKNIVQACFSLGEDGAPGAGGCPNGLSEDTTSPNAARHFPTSPTSDHGTHVSGIATGNDPTRVPPLYGIARGADIIAIQVFSQFSTACGGSPCVLSYSSDQMAGLDHVFSLRSMHNIASANMSLGGGSYNNQAVCDADNAGVKAAIDNLRGAGIATCIASGNDGFCGSISGPGCISSAVAVGATTDSDVEYSISNWDPTLLDIYAPGVNILSSVGTSDSSYNGTWSGTSMATPHVAGAWAVLKQADPGADVATILSALQTTGDPVAGRCVGTPTQRRIQIDLALGTRRTKFIQLPDDTGEDMASNLDRTDMSPNTVVADDFVSDGRPITAVRWWGSNLSLGAAATAAANSADQALRTRSEQPTGTRGVPRGSTIINLGAQSLAQIPEEVRSRGVQHWNGGGLGGTAGLGSVVYENIVPSTSYFPPGVGVILGDDMLLTATASELVSFDNVLVFAEAGANYDVTIELWTDDGSGNPSAIIPGTTCAASALPPGTTWTLGCPVAPGIMLPSRVWMMLTFSTPEAGWVITETAEVGFTNDYFWLIPPGDGYWFGGTPYAGFAGRILAVSCGDGVVEGNEQCDPPDGITCDNNCQVIPNPPIDGWLVSFHEPLTLGGPPSPPLALYFCDATIVTVAATSFGACDTHPVRRYDVDLVDCCLLHSYPDSRNLLTPGQPGAFLETECFNYDIDIQAVVGHTFLSADGVCTTEVLTGNTAAIDFWGWHTTSVEHGLRPALRSMVSMSGPDWLYGPWANITPTCSAPNMAFQLLTDTSGSSGDCNDNGRPDVCESGPDCQPNGVLDECDIAAGTSQDCQPNTIPDECDIASGAADCQPNGVPDVCELAGNDENGNGIPDECDPPGNIVWDANDLSTDRTTRSLRFRVEGKTDPLLEDAIKVTMVDLQNPQPPNAGCCPPKDFHTYESATCTDDPPVGGGGCARWVGNPGTFLESQDLPALGNYRAARLQCTPFYTDWVAETATTPITVVGAEIMPSSTYGVQTYGASCMGNEGTCTNVGTAVTMCTRRSGDVTAPYQNPAVSLSQPDGLDVGLLVAKFKGALSPSKGVLQLQPNLLELNGDINALDILAGVDAFRGKAYSFDGPCPCPSQATCGAFACPPTVCTATNICVGGTNNGADCRVCSNKKCSGFPPNTVCTGTGQGNCPSGQTCNFINCTDNTPCIPTGGTCQPSDSPCTGGGVCTLSSTLGLGAGAMCVKTCVGGSNDGEPCINDSHCPGSSCGSGFCRDACGRCSPP